jgi:hypothetical protein
MAFMFIAFLLSMPAMTSVATHAPASEKVHAYEDHEEQDKNPVLSKPFH